MSSRTHLKHPLLALATALFGLAVGPADVAAGEGGGRSLIVAQGSGEVRVRPDSIHVDVGEETQAATLDEAMAQVNGRMGRVVSALRGLELPALEIETRTLRFSPVYAPPQPNRAPSISGFSASNHVLVTLKGAAPDRLAALGAQIVDAALGAGANTLGGVDFFLADPSQAEDQALTLAVQNAGNDAEIMAKAAGVKLLGVVSIDEPSASRAPRFLPLESMAYGGAGLSTPIEVGEITVTSDVTAKYAFQ